VVSAPSAATCCNERTVHLAKDKKTQMSKAVEKLEAAQRKAMAIRPKVGGFPYLAEVLRQAGVTRNIWSLPSAQSLFVTKEGSIVTQGAPLVSGTVEVPPFDREALITRCAPIRLATAPSLSS
jgi:uncharacterized protein YbcV (DUF1398 family)